MPTWDELFEQEEFRWKIPHEHVIAFTRLLRERGASRVLDLGCGAGRHSVYLEREGFEVFGIDNAETGLRHACEWLRQEKLPARLMRGDIGCIPCASGSFDAILSIYVIYHKTLKGMHEVVAELHRVLKPRGVALVSLQSKRGYRYRCGEEIEPDTFITNIGPDAGVPHHYSDLREIEDLFSPFVIGRVELEERVEKGNRHSHWQVLAMKE